MPGDDADRRSPEPHTGDVADFGDVPWPVGYPEWCAHLNAVQRGLLELEHAFRLSTGLSLVDFYILAALAVEPGHRLRMKELARILRVYPSRATYHVNTLQERGLVVRETNVFDRRGNDVRLTVTGLRAVRAAWADHYGASKDYAALFGVEFVDIPAQLLQGTEAHRPGRVPPGSAQGPIRDALGVGVRALDPTRVPLGQERLG
ncbi:MarR family winged helix-turn-helix transcriptional regulator [Micromonospora sp. NPDC000089]|uniref:MarR family winged helix-turn-helix transcriptional regulator n=1 Tax=unclassified Micromonospora TaxID=2617518 RepID=UPI003683F3BD